MKNDKFQLKDELEAYLLDKEIDQALSDAKTPRESLTNAMKIAGKYFKNGKERFINHPLYSHLLKVLEGKNINLDEPYDRHKK